MENRKLGINGPVVSALGLGCMGISFAYGQIPELRNGYEELVYQKGNKNNNLVYEELITVFMIAAIKLFSNTGI